MFFILCIPPGHSKELSEYAPPGFPLPPSVPLSLLTYISATHLRAAAFAVASGRNHLNKRASMVLLRRRSRISNGGEGGSTAATRVTERSTSSASEERALRIAFGTVRGASDVHVIKLESPDFIFRLFLVSQTYCATRHFNLGRMCCVCL